MSRWGVYVHLPYCKSLCPYCDFNSYVQPDPDWGGLQQALVHELRSRRSLMPGSPAQSLYFGGGTPSMAPASLIATVVDTVREVCGLIPAAEVTLEANPGTVDAAKFTQFLQGGINRISLGWQSTHDRLLRTLGRGHSAKDSADALQAARDAGADNVSLDLIFAVPGQTDQDLDADLARIVELAPQHVSLYALTYHPGTPFYRRKMRGTLVPADEDVEFRMMRRIEQVLSAAGYDHYEVSNYAQPGFRARHNSLYWQGATYLGVGPGAHSFVHRHWQAGWRWENTRKPPAYVAAWQNPQATSQPPVQGDPTVTMAEQLTPRQLLSERMLCGLRQVDGVDLGEPVCQPHAQLVSQAAARAVIQGWAQQEGPHLRPTPLGLENADALAALFF